MGRPVFCCAVHSVLFTNWTPQCYGVNQRRNTVRKRLLCICALVSCSLVGVAMIAASLDTGASMRALSADEKEVVFGGANCCNLLTLCSDRHCPFDCATSDDCGSRLSKATCAHCGRATSGTDCTPGALQGCGKQVPCGCAGGDCYEVIALQADCQTVSACS